MVGTSTLSPLAKEVEHFLSSHPAWRGTYGDLAAAVGKDRRRMGRAIGSVVKALARRDRNFDDRRIIRADTGRAGYCTN
jgi:alkylated DNA nucleotide flippase Atl1